MASCNCAVVLEWYFLLASALNFCTHTLSYTLALCMYYVRKYSELSFIIPRDVRLARNVPFFKSH